MGERIVRNGEVVGSIPTMSTIEINHLSNFRAVYDQRKSTLIGPYWTVNWTVTRRSLRLRTPKVARELGAVPSAPPGRRSPSWSKCESVASDLAPISGRHPPEPTRSHERF